MSKTSTIQDSFFIKGSIILLGAFLFFHILWIGADFLIPLVLSFFFCFAIVGSYHFFHRKQNIPKFISACITAFVFFGILYIIGSIINNNIQSIVELAPVYQEKIVTIANSLLANLGLEQKFSFDGIIQKISIPTLATSLAGALTGLVGYASTIFLYTMFILLEYSYLGNKMNTLAGLTSNPKKMGDIFKKIKKDISSYFVIHSGMSVITGTGTFLICLIFGVDFAAFWGLLAFMLNYIPTIGSIIGWLVPSLFCIVQFGSVGDWGTVVFAVALLGVNQFALGNIIEPKFLGSRLNLSSLVILLSLTFWGYIWGVIGMILSIPIMVVLNITFSYFDSTKWIYVILSETGKLSKK